MFDTQFFKNLFGSLFSDMRKTLKGEIDNVKNASKWSLILTF